MILSPIFLGSKNREQEWLKATVVKYYKRERERGRKGKLVRYNGEVKTWASFYPISGWREAGKGWYSTTASWYYHVDVVQNIATLFTALWLPRWRGIVGTQHHLLLWDFVFYHVGLEHKYSRISFTALFLLRM